MTPLKILLAFTFVIGFIGCKEDQKMIIETPTETEISTFYLIRHAEKDRNNLDDLDPELNQLGLGRAMHWAEIFDDIQFDAVYTTGFNRTIMTASPVSIKQDVDIEYYDTETLDIEAFKTTNKNKNVLVVGHSNTTPDFVNQLLGEEKYAPMEDDDNGSLFIVTIINGVATAQQLHINCTRAN